MNHIPGSSGPLSSVDWAIAGTSSSCAREDGGVPRSRWHHWIDSRTVDVDQLVDEGDMYPQPDGSTLEKGRMVNPPTGHETDYEELWRSETIEAVPCGPPGMGTGAGDAAVVCVVLQLQLDEQDSSPAKRGMVVRLGQYCQGLLRNGKGPEDVTVERLRWDAANACWNTVFKVGHGKMPTDFAIYFGHEACVRDEVKDGRHVWKVVEKS